MSASSSRAAPSGVSLARAIAVHARIASLRLRRGRMAWALAALVFLPVLITCALAAIGNFGVGLYDEMLQIYFRFLVPCVPALLMAPTVTDEIDAQTFTFVFSRPAPRAALLYGRLLAVIAPLAALTALSLAAIFAVALARFPGDYAGALPHLAMTELAALVGLVAYAGVGALIGTRALGHPVAATLGWLVLIEAGVGSTPTSWSRLSLAWHLRNLAGLSQPTLASFSAPPLSVLVSVIVLLAAPTICLVVAGRSIARAEYHDRGANP